LNGILGLIIITNREKKSVISFLFVRMLSLFIFVLIYIYIYIYLCSLYANLLLDFWARLQIITLRIMIVLI